MPLWTFGPSVLRSWPPYWNSHFFCSNLVTRCPKDDLSRAETRAKHSSIHKSRRLSPSETTFFCSPWILTVLARTHGMSFFLQLSCVLGDLERKRRFLCSNSLYEILTLQTWKLHSTTLSKFIPGNEIYLHVPTLEAICLLAECNSTIPKINILDPHERIIFSEIIHEHSLYQFETWNLKTLFWVRSSWTT